MHRATTAIVALLALCGLVAATPVTGPAPDAPAGEDGTADRDDRRAADRADDPAAALGADHVVHVGADDPASPAPPSPLDRFEYLTYFPERLQVHRGDVVAFVWRGDHTVTFHPGGERVDTLLVADELPLHTRVDGIFPSRDDCDMGLHRSDLPPCAYEGGDQYLNTGASPPSDDYRARIAFDVPPGTYAYFCSFHPQMRGEVEVVPDDVEVPTPAEVDEARRRTIAQLTAEAEAVMAEIEAAPARDVVDGRVRWRVHVGAATADGRVHVLRYLPSDLAIAAGDEVEFVMPPAPRVEAHSASFLPLPDELRALAPAHYLDLRCDQDGTDAGAPGLPGGTALFVAAGGCPVGELETLYQPWAFAAPLAAPDGAVRGDRPVHDSGMMLTPQEGCDDACDPWSGERMPSGFVAHFPEAGTFEYWCFLHDPRGMAASITVTP